MLPKKITLKQRRWLKYFFETANQTEAARLAGYKCKNEEDFSVIGSENYRKLKAYIIKWLNKEGLTDERLKAKLNSLLEAKETKFFTHEGLIVSEKEVSALHIQKSALDMAFKIKGLYAPLKIEDSNDMKDIKESNEELEIENKKLEEMLKKMDDKNRDIKKNKRKQKKTGNIKSKK